MEVKVCPACQSGDARPTGPEAPGFTVRADTKNFVQEPYAVMECAQCGLLYKTRCLTAEEFADYYARINFRRWEIPEFYPTERAVLAILRRMPFGSKILDFGCSSGRLLAPLVSTCRCYGYDLNRTATADAHAKGIEIMAEREFACAPDGSFDVVILVDVFEHFLSPTSLLSRLISLIKPGGLLIIVTGNGDNAFCRLDPAQFWYFRNIEHIIMLTRRYAESLAHHFRLTLGQYEIATHYDASWWRKIVQFTQHFAYWQFRKRNHFIAKLFRLFPEIRKAERWPVAPGFSGSKDHVIAVFEKHDCSE